MKLIFISIAITLLFTAVLGDTIGVDPCPNDRSGECMNKKALEYTNDLRRQAGKKPLVAGPEDMLKNALKHSAQMSKLKCIYHQKLLLVNLGGDSCSFHPIRENVAVAYAPNKAFQCVYSRWNNSRGHRINMMRDDMTIAAVGIHRNAKGASFCTMTLSRKPVCSSPSPLPMIPVSAVGPFPAKQPDGTTVQSIRFCGGGECVICPNTNPDNCRALLRDALVSAADTPKPSPVPIKAEVINQTLSNGNVQQKVRVCTGANLTDCEIKKSFCGFK